MKANILLDLVIEVFLTNYDKDSIRLEVTTLESNNEELSKIPHQNEIIVIKGSKFFINNVIFNYDDNIIELKIKNYNRINHYDVITDEDINDDKTLNDFRYIYKPLDKFLDLGWKVVSNKIIKDNVKQIIDQVKDAKYIGENELFAISYNGKILGLFKNTKNVVEHLKSKYSAKDVDNVFVLKCKVNNTVKFNEMQILSKWNPINFCLKFDTDWLEEIKKNEEKIKKEKAIAFQEYLKKKEIEDKIKKSNENEKIKTTYKPKVVESVKVEKPIKTKEKNSILKSIKNKLKGGKT